MRASHLNVVVIVVELDLQLVRSNGITGGLECLDHVRFANRIIPNVAGIRTSGAVRECFIYHIPAVATIAEVLYKSCNVSTERS